MQNSRVILRNLLIAVLLMVLGGMVGYRIKERGGIQGAVSQPLAQFQLTNTEQPSDFQKVDFSQFWEVWSILERDYLDHEKLQQDKMVYGAIQGMTSSLQDPYTVFLPPVDQKRSEEDLSGSFYGVGIQLGYIDNVLAVQAPLKGSPAERAGVKAKDLILHVKDERKGFDKDTQGWSLSEAVDHIRGDAGTSVILTLLRRDEKPEPFTVTLERGEIIVPSAELSYIEKKNKKYAHITLSRFGERTDAELAAAIRDIKGQRKVDGIILDLRNNPGGFLDGAITVASKFIKTGTVVTQKGKYTSRDYSTKGLPELADYPVIVVVNGGSASASEIVAGALRDRRNAKLVGEKTFGKGTVQDALKLDGGAGLHVTIARWLLPKGDWIHDTGIPVTVEVKDDEKTPEDEVINRAVEEIGK